MGFYDSHLLENDTSETPIILGIVVLCFLSTLPAHLI